MVHHAKPDPLGETEKRPWKTSDITPAMRNDPYVVPAGMTEEEAAALAADMASRGLKLNNGHWYRGRPVGDPPKVPGPSVEARLDAIEDFLATLPIQPGTDALMAPIRELREDRLRQRRDRDQEQRDKEGGDSGKPGK